MPRLSTLNVRVFSGSIFVYLGLSIVTCAALALMMTRSISPYDEAIIVVGAKEVQRGALPYRDFYANYGPANFYILAWLFHAFGSSILVERAWDTLVRSATVLVCFSLLRTTISQRLASVASLLITAWLGSIGTYSYPVFPSFLCCISGLFFISKSRDSGYPSAWSFAAGAAAGLTALFRFDVGIYAIVALGASSVLVDRWRSVLTSFVAGVAAVGVPSAIAFLAAGALQDLIFQNLVFPLHSYAANRSLPFPALATLIADPYQIAVYAPIVVVALSLSALAIDLKRRAQTPNQVRWLLLSLCLLSAVLFLKGIVRVSIVHMSISLLPAVLLSVVSVSLMRPKAPLINGAVLLSLTAIAIPSLVAVKQDMIAVRDTLDWLSYPGTWTDPTAKASCHPDPYLARLRCFEVDRTWARVVAELQALSRPDEPIFVGLAHHDRVFVNNVLTYFAAQRRPATKWYHFDPGLQTTTAIQDLMIADLNRSRPPAIVLDDTWGTVREPNASAISSGVTRLDDYLSATFQTVERLGPYTIAVPRTE